jgi:hypothetical protein
MSILQKSWPGLNLFSKPMTIKSGIKMTIPKNQIGGESEI